MDKLPRYLIFTDASFKKSSKDGSWAYAVIDFDSHEIVNHNFGYFNNKNIPSLDVVYLEIYALKEALNYIKTKPESLYIVCTDAIQNYNLVDDIKNGREQLFQNKKTLLTIGEEVRNLLTQITPLHLYIEKIKAHSGICYNNYVDNIATRVRLNKGDIGELNSNLKIQNMKKIVFELLYEKFWQSPLVQKLNETFEQIKTPIELSPKGTYLQNKKNSTKPSNYNGEGSIELLNYNTPAREALIEISKKEKILIKEFKNGKISFFYQGGHFYYYPDKANKPITYDNATYFNMDLSEVIEKLKTKHLQCNKKFRI